MKLLKSVAAATAGLALSAGAWAEDPASCESGENLAGGRSYEVLLPSKKDGQTISFQVLEPTSFDCDKPGAHPLMLHGPGFSGTKSTSGFSNFRDAGYTVISWDPRGFGKTTGSVRVMDPEFEGQYYVEILDWAEQNLDYLAWRNEAATARPFVPRPQDKSSKADGINLVVGAQGSSYGGGYQMMLLTVDRKKRLDAIIPDITWHDLRNSLNPGDGVKTMWDLVLSGAGTGVGYASDFPNSVEGMDPYIEETLLRGATLNEWPRESLDWFHYRGLGYWCAANGYPAMPYAEYGPDNVPMQNPHGNEKAPGDNGLGPYLVAVDANKKDAHFAGLDVLITQGMIDTLFTYNEAWWNTRCLSAAGADVSLYTHNTGHALPFVQSPDKPPANSNACPVDALAWFDSRLKPGGTPTQLEETCFALGTGDDVVYLDRADVIAPGASDRYTTVALQGVNPEPQGVVVPNGPVGIAHIGGNAAVPAVLGTVQDGGAILAGIPHLEVTVSSLHGLNEEVRGQAGDAIGRDGRQCQQSSTPLRLGCDSEIFVGLGKKVAGGMPNYALIDDQVMPLRGLGTHSFDLTGVAERLNAGDELALLFFAEHPQFFGSASRDVTLPAVLVTGSVSLPLYAVDGGGNPDPDAVAAGQLGN